MTSSASVERAYRLARQRYAELGVNTDRALAALRKIPISLHCWQGDDVGGFESSAGLTGGGIQATGNYPGRARTADELRSDLDVVFSMIPGRHRLSLHAIYLEPGRKRVDRNEVQPRHFAHWVDWAKSKRHGLDFNPTFFSHPKAADGFTLSHPDKGIRKFWIEHGIACRKIGAWFGRQLGSTCVTNVWIPDGYKDIPVDRVAPRERLRESLDTIFAEKINPKYHLDAVEGKLFGIGSESFVVGSHEFYLAYAVTRDVLLTLDAGHFHPTEVISTKLSAVLCFAKEMLLHVSRPVRWDSDHVVILDDELLAIGQEIVRNNYTDRIHIGLDYFDASINRVAAWAVGTRNMRRALLRALLEPGASFADAERRGDLTARLARMEEAKSLPWGAVWDRYCASRGAPVGVAWLDAVRAHEAKVADRRAT